MAMLNNQMVQPKKTKGLKYLSKVGEDNNQEMSITLLHGCTTHNWLPVSHATSGAYPGSYQTATSMLVQQKSPVSITYM